MNSAGIKSLDRDVIESVLKMGGGYVLDFSDRTFTEFFADFGVQIDNESFRTQGTSKANRLRCFLKTAEPVLAGKVLAALLDRRLIRDPEGLNSTEAEHYRKVVARLSGELQDESNTRRSAEAELLRRVFRPELFERLPVDASMSQVLVDRMNEAQRCIDTNAHLAAIILCGSVLEGMCLGYGSRNIERVNRGYAARFNRAPRQLHEWRLKEWIDVLAHLGDLSPNVEKFGHGLRDFRNYVHPAEQLAHRFSPDQHTARIGFQVVIAAAEDLVRAAADANRSP